MICRKCGKEVNETDKFCEHCGNNLTRKTFAEILKQYKRQILAIFIVIVAILTGLLSYQYYDSHKKLVNPYYKNLAKIGAFIRQEDGKTVIVDFFKDSTSDKSDLEKGDIILKVDNKKVKNLSYARAMLIIDIKNQKIGYQQVDYYDSKHNIIKSENYADKSGKVELEDIKPNSKGYSLYEMIKRIDDNSSDREKEQFKGFLE